MPRSSHIPCEMCSSRSLRSLYVTMLLRALLAWQSRLDHRSALGTGVGHGTGFPSQGSPREGVAIGLCKVSWNKWSHRMILFYVVLVQNIYAFVYKFHSFSSIYLYIILIWWCPKQSKTHTGTPLHQFRLNHLWAHQCEGLHYPAKGQGKPHSAPMLEADRLKPVMPGLSSNGRYAFTWTSIYTI